VVDERKEAGAGEDEVAVSSLQAAAALTVAVGVMVVARSALPSAPLPAASAITVALATGAHMESRQQVDCH
jgi:predicted anti-sigma-YlaC factor YlaD